MTLRTDFDVERTQTEKALERLAEAMSARWCTVTERNKLGRPTAFELSPQCNQEPCYEELLLQKYRGVRPENLRAAALDARKALNGGYLSLPPHLVKQAVYEACNAVDAHRLTIPVPPEIRKWVESMCARVPARP